MFSGIGQTGSPWRLAFSAIPKVACLYLIKTRFRSAQLN